MPLSCLVGKGEFIESVWAGNDEIKIFLEEGSYGNSVWFSLKRESLEAAGQFESYWNLLDKVIRG